MDHTVRLYPLESVFSTSNLKVNISLFNWEMASPLKSSCCNERFSIFNRLFTTFLESQLESVIQQFGSLTTPSKEKDEGKPSFKFKLYTFHRGLRYGFCFSSFLHHTARELKS